MSSCNCVRADDDCLECYAYNPFIDYCSQDDDLKGNGPGDYSFSKAKPVIVMKKKKVKATSLVLSQL
jgi:hypothetical protein